MYTGIDVLIIVLITIFITVLLTGVVFSCAVINSIEREKEAAYKKGLKDGMRWRG